MEPNGVRAEPQVGRPTQSEHPTAQPIILRTREGDALCTSLQTVRNEDDSFDIYLARVIINGKEKMFAWHTINFMMACEMPRLDELMNWLHERPGRTFTNLDHIQLGFMDPDDPEDDPAYAKNWQLRRIVYASGKKYGWESNCFYASDQDHGGPSTFWQVRFHTISSFRIGGLYTPSFLKLGGRKIGTKAGKKYRKNGVHLEADPECRKGYLDELFFVCVANEDVFVPLGAAGSRGSSKVIQQLLVHNELTFCTGDAGYCIRTAVANAIAIADGHGAVREMLELEDIPDRGLAAVGAWIESALKKYSLRKVQVPDWQETHEYLLAQKSGIFLAKLEGVDQDGESIWHTVLVESARRLVFDGCEKHALRLCNDSFDACVGDDFSFIGVKEVRLFNIHKVGKRPGRSRRMPKGKRKLRNKARPSIPSSEGVRKPTRQTRKRIVKEIED